ncbi:hypothetical protein EPN29_07765 [bacterium]|nr:MAG: hypothetical protein EPN29_07765 [bacterium]
MAPTEMEESPAPIEQVTAQPIEPYDPPTRAVVTDARTPGFIPRERRLWIAALAAALLVTVAGLGLLYLDDTGYQSADRALTMQNESLTGRNQNLQDQLKSTQTNLTATLGQLATVRAELEHPHLTIWNVPQQVKGSSWYLAGGVPDTFTYHLNATSNGPMSVSILTLEQWAKAIACVDSGAGTTNYCMHHNGAVISWLNVTSVSYDFHLGEGCADYLSVFTAASNVTVTPNVSVTYNPASSTTGACA